MQYLKREFMKIAGLLFITFLIISCGSDESGVQEECQTDNENVLAGCWLYDRCYPSFEFPGHSIKTGIALGAGGIVSADFTRNFNSSDCTANRNGYTALTPAGTYQVMDDFINANGLAVTEFHYSPYPGVVKMTYYYFNDDKLCFPVNTFMGDYNEFDISRLNDHTAYDELNEQIDLANCFTRVNSF